MTDAPVFLAVLAVSVLTLACCVYLVPFAYRIALSLMGEERDAD